MRAVLGALVLAVLVGSTAPSSAGPDRAEGVWPLVPDPEVVRGFEPPPHPFAAGHRGVDLAGRPGQAVRAALPGTVGFAGLHRRQARRHRAARRSSYDLRAGRGLGRAGPGGGRGRRAGPAHAHRQPLLPRGLPALGPAPRARSTSTRSPSSARDRCGCCPCGATSLRPCGSPGLRRWTAGGARSTRCRERAWSRHAGRHLCRWRDSLDHHQRIRWRVSAHARGWACW